MEEKHKQQASQRLPSPQTVQITTAYHSVPRSGNWSLSTLLYEKKWELIDRGKVPS